MAFPEREDLQDRNSVVHLSCLLFERRLTSADFGLAEVADPLVVRQVS